MSAHRRTGINLLLSTFFLIPLMAQAAELSNGRIEIAGEYRYTYRDPASVADAKNLACREAFRLAVVNSSLYREQTASVVDSPLLRDLAYTLSTSHVQDQQIIEQTERKRTVSCRVKGFLPAEETARVIRTQLAGGGAPTEGLDQNRALRILSVREEGRAIAIQYQR